MERTRRLKDRFFLHLGTVCGEKRESVTRYRYQAGRVERKEELSKLLPVA